jgi:hypothetical protein
MTCIARYAQSTIFSGMALSEFHVVAGVPVSVLATA